MYTNLLMKSVDLSLAHFCLQAISLYQRQFHVLFYLEALDLSGQGEAEMLRHDPVCWNICNLNIHSQMY